ncbi:CheR family methyltransferase [Candidatus Nitrospira allomarina]|uniref:protein-glutamate O-methyltransferase n=1 Tax=Candidatus Nitrospira allomarina TaxID=3020900 RepID=A0AA96JQT6_9BACT|nr:protein-glutamate O-methyltransferase [Candidatus Nitrospira allomarina]WNM56787.1 protein-glutamate O-methyltransferase [Candidatus Nitrospira allomarina]
MLTDKEFELFKHLIYQQVGIKLDEPKKTLLVSRLGKRLRDLHLSSYQAYYDCVSGEGGEEELIKLLDLVSTNKTEFYREPVHFDFLRDQVLPEVQSSKILRIWSSASSSGEEPYTIAMTLADAITDINRWDIKILASDISTRVLAKASSGIYEEERVSQLPHDLVKRHFLRGKGPQAGKLQVRPQVARLVAFRRINLMDPTFPIRSQLDVIFCRNVMIYFDRPTQARLMEKFFRYLRPGGYLFIGHSESLQWIDHQFTYLRPTIYQKPVGVNSQA